MFDACTYFLTRDLDTALMASGVFKSLTRGEKSSVESSAVNIWQDDENVKNIKEYLSRFLHPLFKVIGKIEFLCFNATDKIVDIEYILSVKSIEPITGIAMLSFILFQQKNFRKILTNLLVR